MEVQCCSVCRSGRRCERSLEGPWAKSGHQSRSRRASPWLSSCRMVCWVCCPNCSLSVGPRPGGRSLLVVLSRVMNQLAGGSRKGSRSGGGRERGGMGRSFIFQLSPHGKCRVGVQRGDQKFGGMVFQLESFIYRLCPLYLAPGDGVRIVHPGGPTRCGAYLDRFVSPGVSRRVSGTISPDGERRDNWGT